MNELELLNKLKELAKETGRKNSFVKDYRFFGTDQEFKEMALCETYQDAKNWAEQGGYVLCLDNNKVYSYKVKTQDEYEKYLSNQIKRDSYNKMNRYGL